MPLLPISRDLVLRLKRGDDLMPLLTQIQVIWTVVVMIVFLSIVIWAWSGRRKESFDEAANIPLEEENFLQEEIKTTEVKKENSNA